MPKTLSLMECLGELQRTLAYRQLSLPLWAFEEGLTPEQARWRINCLKGALVTLLVQTVGTEEVPV